MGSSHADVYTLLVNVGRAPDDGLPKGATGAGILLFSSGVDEAEAVREAVAILKKADLAPLEVTGYGTLEERRAAGHEIGDEEVQLMRQALDQNAVIVVETTPFFDPDPPQ